MAENPKFDALLEKIEARTADKADMEAVRDQLPALMGHAKKESGLQGPELRDLLASITEQAAAQGVSIPQSPEVDKLIAGIEGRSKQHEEENRGRDGTGMGEKYTKSKTNPRGRNK